MRRQPSFWTERSAIAYALLPLSLLYGAAVTVHRMLRKPQTLSVPVIGIGNITIGGAGKTPTSIALVELLVARGYRPHILSRGYGAHIGTPIRVSPAHHTSADVGDEALLLAQHVPTWVHPDRIASGDAAVAAGASIIVCDDAMQHHRLRKDINLLVLDGAYGIGNGFLLPAGPLREPLGNALSRTDAVILIGEDANGLCKSIEVPVFRANLSPIGDTSWLKGTKVTAFAGIARPQKFYDTLESLGVQIIATHDFPDHHPFRDEELATLIQQGTAITTQKDWVRLSPEWQARIRYLPVALNLAEPDRFMDWLEKRVRA